MIIFQIINSDLDFATHTATHAWARNGKQTLKLFLFFFSFLVVILFIVLLFSLCFLNQKRTCIANQAIPAKPITTHACEPKTCVVRFSFHKHMVPYVRAHIPLPMTQVCLVLSA